MLDGRRQKEYIANRACAGQRLNFCLLIIFPIAVDSPILKFKFFIARTRTTEKHCARWWTKSGSQQLVINDARVVDQLLTTQHLLDRVMFRV